MKPKEPRYLLASTGGSGSGYTLRYLFHLLELPGETHWIASQHFFEVLKQEYSLDWSALEAGELPEKIMEFFSRVYSVEKPQTVRHRFHIYHYQDIAAIPASGSVHFDSMVILPCSMKTLATVASGITMNLIERAADVCLKERRRLLLVIRETPYQLVHIENMRQLTLAGATIMPASPAFYHHPEGLLDIFDFMVDRIFMHMGMQKRTIAPYRSIED